jgi:protein tyrosine/serine phosphatase
MKGGFDDMKVMVMNREQAKRFSFQQHNFETAIISITDPDKPEVLFDRSRQKNGIRFVTRVSFWDEEEDEHGCISEAQAQVIAEAALDAKAFLVDTILVHCEAGKCRSAGVAAAILKVFTGDDTAVFNDPQYTPNMRCYRRVLNALTETMEKIG